MSEPAVQTPKKRRGIWTILGVFLLVMLILYLLSGQIEDFLYPTVRCTFFTVGKTVLDSSGSAELTVQYEKTDEVKAPADAKVLSGGLKPGDHFRAGDVLIYLSVGPNGTTITAPYDGIVCDVLYRDSAYCTVGDCLMTISPDGTELVGKFSVDTERADSVPGGIFKVSAYQEQAGGMLKQVYFVTSSAVNTDTGMTDYFLSLPKEDGFAVGEAATAIYEMVLPQTFDHPVVPRDYVWDVSPDETSGVIYSIGVTEDDFGRKYIAVANPVMIIGGNGGYYSISGADIDRQYLIIASSRELRGGVSVRVSEEEVSFR